MCGFFSIRVFLCALKILLNLKDKDGQTAVVCGLGIKKIRLVSPFNVLQKLYFPPFP